MDCICSGYASEISSNCGSFPVHDESYLLALKDDSRKMMKLMLKKCQILSITVTDDSEMYNEYLIRRKKDFVVEYHHNDNPNITFKWTIPNKDIIDF